MAGSSERFRTRFDQIINPKHQQRQRQYASRVRGEETISKIPDMFPYKHIMLQDYAYALRLTPVSGQNGV